MVRWHRDRGAAIAETPSRISHARQIYLWIALVAVTSPKFPKGPSVAVVVPFRRVVEGEPAVVRRKAGRPRRLERAPFIDEVAYHRTIGALVEQMIANDPVVRTATIGTPLDVLDALIRETAVECASLEWDRRQAVERGKASAEMISTRRIGALCRLGDLVLAREQLRREAGDLDPVQLALLVALFLADFQEVAGEVCGEWAEPFVAKVLAKIAAAKPP